MPKGRNGAMTAAALALSLACGGCQHASDPSVIVAAIPTSEKLTEEGKADIDDRLTRRIDFCADLTAYSPHYVPLIRVAYAPDGRIVGEPQDVARPASDEERRASAGAIKAVKRCDPIVGGGMTREHYPYWRERIYRFAHDGG